MSLDLAQIDFRYAADAPLVLRDVNLRVHGGQMLGLTAPSGSGKSTLVKIAALLLAPQSGTVSIAGQVVHGVGYRVDPVVRQRIGVVMQSPRAATNPRLSLAQIIAEPLNNRSRKVRTSRTIPRHQVQELADRVQLTGDLLDRLPHQVSDGQLQRACLARAFAGDPDVLLCDEPSAMLDAPTTAVLMHALAAQAAHGAAVLVASHDTAVLRAICDNTMDLTRRGS